MSHFATAKWDRIIGPVYYSDVTNVGPTASGTTTAANGLFGTAYVVEKTGMYLPFIAIGTTGANAGDGSPCTVTGGVKFTSAVSGSTVYLDLTSALTATNSGQWSTMSSVQPIMVAEGSEVQFYISATHSATKTTGVCEAHAMLRAL